MSEKPEPTYGGKRAGAGRKKSAAPSAAALKKREQRERKKAGETKPKGRPRKAPARSKSRTKETTTTGAKPIKLQIEVTGAGRGASRGTSRGRSASRGRGSVTPKVPPQIPAPAPVIVQPPPPDTSTNLALMGIQREQQNTIAQTLQMQQEQIARGQEQFEQLTGTTREALLQMGDATKSRFERLESQMADIPERTTRMASNFILQSRGSRADNLQQPFSQEAPMQPAFHAPVFPEPLSLEEQSRQSSEAEMKRTTSGLVGNDFNRTGQVGREFNRLPDAPPEFKQRERDEPIAFQNIRSSVTRELRASSDPIQEKRAEQDTTAIGKSLNRQQESGLEELSDVKQYLRLQKATAEAQDTSKDIEKLLKQSDQPDVEVQSPLQAILTRGEQRRRQQWISEGSPGTFEEWDEKRRIRLRKQEEEAPPVKKSEPVTEAPPVKKSEPKPALDEPIMREATEAEQKEAEQKEAEETADEDEDEDEDEEEPELVFRGTDPTTPFMKNLETHLEEMIEASPESQQTARTNTLKVFNEQVKGKIPLTLFALKRSEVNEQLKDYGLSNTDFGRIQGSIKKNSELKRKLVKGFKKDNPGRDEDELDDMIAL